MVSLAFSIARSQNSKLSVVNSLRFFEDAEFSDICTNSLLRAHDLLFKLRQEHMHVEFN